MAMIVKAASYSLFGAAITKVRIASTPMMMIDDDARWDDGTICD
jgi:hypothetical protein